MFKTIVRGKEYRFTLIFIFLIILFTAYDIMGDLNDKVPYDHILHEISILLFSLVLFILQLRSSANKSTQIKLMGSELEKLNKEKEEYRSDLGHHAQAIADAIEVQLNNWELTASEKDIALLLIKGLSMKEIAELRNSKESTVRQQAMAVYKKSNLQNRQQLAAFFLEDIL